MKKYLVPCFLFGLLLTISCEGDDKKQQELMQQLDSLQIKYDERDADYNDLNGYLNLIAESLDSISMQEGLIFQKNTTPGESPTLSRKRIRENLMNFKETLNKQRMKIEEIEKKLSSSSRNVSNLQKIITSLKEQLAAKDTEIIRINQELNNKNRSIVELTQLSSSLKETNTEQTQQINQQDEIIKNQDVMLNEGYIKIGTKSELKKLGLLSSGNLLKKSKVSYTNVDKGVFEKVDIRNISQIEIFGKKPKILTPVPSDSYEMETNGNTTLLRIVSPDRFWSISNYLIIQTN
ncbi:MAG: hypothetical protein IJK42_00615 [Prevotella sp.]|nr:hypothetical protein [Prevotella sp.]